MASQNLPTTVNTPSLSPQIPNLLTSRGGGPRSRGRGRGRGAPSSQGRASNADPSLRLDETIQSTDTDAAVSRLSAVEAGYLDDGFARFFVRGLDGGVRSRRLPVINRGTYTRTTALDILVERFLCTPSSTSTSSLSPLPQLEDQQIQRQIISLGAGTDTRYFRLRKANKLRNVIYHEIDFPSVCKAKEGIVRRTMGVFGVEGERMFPERREPEAMNGKAAGEGSLAVEESITEWGFLDVTGEGGTLGGAANGNTPYTPHYVFHPLDLRHIPNLPSLSYINPHLPTLLISECCLCYLPVPSTSAIIKWFTDQIPNLGIILYEPMGPDDAFGRMMVENLAARGIKMPTVGLYRTLEAQVARLRNGGFGAQKGAGDVGIGVKAGDGRGGVMAMTVEDIWAEWIEIEEKERVDGLEGLDEVEEWQLLARHYAVVWGWRGPGFEGWEGWGAGMKMRK